MRSPRRTYRLPPVTKRASSPKPLLTLPNPPAVDQHFHGEGGMVGLVAVKDERVAAQCLDPGVEHHGSLVQSTGAKRKEAVADTHIALPEHPCPTAAAVSDTPGDGLAPWTHWV